MNKNDQININDERQVRLNKLKELKNAGINPYPARSDRQSTVRQALAAPEGEELAIAGRIMLKREMGKLTFCHIQDDSSRMQAVFKQDEIDKNNYKIFVKKIDIGDIISVKGTRFVTQKGEDSILVREWKLLAKSLLPLPDKFHGLLDDEKRLRKRYLDLLLNPETKQLFERKARFWSATGEFLREKGFLAVETPVLEVTTGGADATPFKTHHNALDMDVYLRISMGELWQKRLMVAGFEKTYEIGRQFRNEGMSKEHLQDYTQMEFYWAYADYTMGMELVEEMFKYVIGQAFGKLKFSIGEFKNIDLSLPWQKINYAQIIEELTGINILEADEGQIRKKLDQMKIDYEDNLSRARLVDSLWKICRKQVKGPAFLVDHPVFISPLSKRKKEDGRLTERFQVIIAGSELGNGYSELNDPIDQAERFSEQLKMRQAGDSEAHMYDKEFVEALEHGMPPTCGFGFSERVFAYFADKPMRECVLFPLMKPETED